MNLQFVMYRIAVANRSGLSYQITQNFLGISGMGCFISYNHHKLNRIEIRPYQEVNSSQVLRKVAFMHRFRSEARYFKSISDGAISSETNFNLRFRYRLYATFPILKLSEKKSDKTLLMNVGDELFICVGKEIIYNMFDNNRILIELTLRYNKNLNYSITYINQFSQRNIPDTFDHSNIFTFSFLHKISLLKEAITSE